MADLEVLLDRTTTEGQRFYEAFFKSLDARSAAPEGVQANTKIVWNGSPLAGSEAFMDMLRRMPTTSHKITGYNAHPFPNSTPEALNIMIDTTGAVNFGSNRKDHFGFQATFVVRRMGAGASYVLQQLVYRLTYKPADSTIDI